MSNLNKIVFFTEFSKKKGLGHFVRSRRLYEYLRKKNFEIEFYYNKKRQFITKYLKKITKKTMIIFDLKDYDKFHYYYKEYLFYIFFDNSSKEKKNSLNINPLLPSKKKFSGPMWYPFPENFFFNKNKKKNKSSKILIVQGGTDPHSNLKKILDSFNNNSNFKFNLSILSSNYKLKSYNKKFNLIIKNYKNINNLAKFINSHDYIITACGNFCYEINFFGIKCCYATSEPREVKLGKYLQKKGFGKLFTKKNISKLFNHVQKDILKKKNINERTKKISYFRHNGLKNIYKLILKKFNEI